MCAKRTVHAVLDRRVSQARKRNRANKAVGTPLSEALEPDDLWCADFKGEFRLGTGRYCYPLTITDQASRYLLCCEAFDSTREQGVFEAFRAIFTERGLPYTKLPEIDYPFHDEEALVTLRSVHRLMPYPCNQFSH